MLCSEGAIGLAFCIGVEGITGGIGVMIFPGILLTISGTTGGIAVIIFPGVTGSLSLWTTDAVGICLATDDSLESEALS